MKLSIVMPAYNEGTNIYNNLLETEHIVNAFCDSYEIICVNDGSRDNTEKEIMRATEAGKHIRCVSYQDNGGKGYAIKQGVEKAKGEYIAFLDADLELSPKHLKRFLEEIQQQHADIAIGSKLHKDSVVNYPILRKIMSRVYYCMLVVLFHLKVHDTQTGVKLFKADLLKNIIGQVTTTGYAYDIEILALANELGAKIIEMPVKINFSRESGMARISCRDIIKVFTDTILIKERVLKFKKS